MSANRSESRNMLLSRRFSEVESVLQNAVKGAGVLSRVLVSSHEAYVYAALLTRFDSDDILYRYGIHPLDGRYPHNCDFYIRSLDLFIELHCSFAHGPHWFDASNPADVSRQRDLLAQCSRRCSVALDMWCRKDLLKREDARRSGIRYLVFWDRSLVRVRKDRVPALADFYTWFCDYDCDYGAFIADYPGNTC